MRHFLQLALQLDEGLLGLLCFAFKFDLARLGGFDFVLQGAQIALRVFQRRLPISQKRQKDKQEGEGKHALLLGALAFREGVCNQGVPGHFLRDG